MTSSLSSPKADKRVAELIARFSAPDACAAYLLCDGHPPGATAYTVVASDLSARKLTFGELKAQSEKFAAGLKSLGVGPGDRVATLMGKSVEFLVALLGIWRLGAVHVPLFTAFAPPAIAFRLNGSAAKVVVCDDTQRPKLAAGDDIPANPPWRVICLNTTSAPASDAIDFADFVAKQPTGLPAAKLGGNAPMIQIYTSGTTGRPKGVIAPIKALASFQIYAEFGQGVVADDVFWCAADPGWAYGLFLGILCALTTGAHGILVQGGFDAKLTYDVMAKFGVTNFAAAPTVYRSLRVSDVPAPKGLKLRRLSSAGEPLTPEVNQWTEQTFGLLVHDHYGQTETAMTVNNHHDPELQRPLRTGSMGHAMPGWTALVLKMNEDKEAATDEVGRLAFDLTKSPLMWFTGYVDEPTKSAEKFSKVGPWYVTGDTARVDKDGYVHFSARDDDVIIMAGYRIGPFEVESVIATHPSVNECAVIAAPDATRGEVLESYVVLKSGVAGSPDVVEDIQQWVKTKYAAHAYPRSVHFVDSLPKTPSGKIQRFVLRQQRRDELAKG